MSSKSIDSDRYDMFNIRITVADNYLDSFFRCVHSREICWVVALVAAELVDLIVKDTHPE